MSILIKGVKSPKSCFGCHLFMLDDQDLWCITNHYAGCCRVLSKYIDEDKFVKERHPDCPLIEVPTPHGRLIDADKFKADYSMKNDCAECEKELRHSSRSCEYDRIYSKMDFCGWLDDAPTVIKAEE